MNINKKNKSKLPKVFLEYTYMSYDSHPIQPNPTPSHKASLII